MYDGRVMHTMQSHGRRNSKIWFFFHIHFAQNFTGDADTKYFFLLIHMVQVTDCSTTLTVRLRVAIDVDFSKSSSTTGKYGNPSLCAHLNRRLPLVAHIENSLTLGQ